MRYRYLLSALSLLGTLSLYANEDKLSSILQNTGEQKALLKPVEKKTTKKQSRFVFKDEYNNNGIGKIDKKASKEKAESYDYKNRSRFKFKFNDGYQKSNLVGSYGGGGVSGSMGGGQAGGQGAGGGGHGGGGRR